MKAFWDRRTKIEGGYILERAENIEAFCKAVGKADAIPHFKDYRMHIFENGNTYRISEFIGDLGRFSNTMQLDEECLVKVPGGEEGIFKSCRNNENDKFSIKKCTHLFRGVQLGKTTLGMRRFALPFCYLFNANF